MKGFSKVEEKMTIIQMSKTKHCSSGKKKICLEPRYSHETLLGRKSSHSSFCQAFCRCHSYVRIGEKWDFSRVVILPIGRHGGAHGGFKHGGRVIVPVSYRVHWAKLSSK